MFFNVIGKAILRNVAEQPEEKVGAVIERHNIWNLRYADDTILLDISLQKLQKI